MSNALELGEGEDSRLGAIGLGGGRGGVAKERSSFALTGSREIEEADLRLVGDEKPACEKLP